MNEDEKNQGYVGMGCAWDAVSFFIYWETSIFPFKGTLEDDFPIPQVGYVSSLEGTRVLYKRMNSLSCDPGWEVQGELSSRQRRSVPKNQPHN